MCSLAGGMRAYDPVREVPRRMLRICPARPSYLESLIDSVFAPSRARRPAGLKRRAANNEPRNSCSSSERYFDAHEVNVHSIRADDTELTARMSENHVTCWCVRQFFFFLFMLSLWAFETRHNARKCRVFHVIAVLPRNIASKNIHRFKIVWNIMQI